MTIKYHYWEPEGDQRLKLEAQRDYDKAIQQATLVVQANSDELGTVNVHPSYGLAFTSFDEEEIRFPASIEDLQRDDMSFDYAEEPTEFEILVMAVLSIFRFYIPHCFYVGTDATPARWMPAIKLARRATKLDIQLPLSNAEWQGLVPPDDKNLVKYHWNLVNNTIPKWKL